MNKMNRRHFLQTGLAMVPLVTAASAFDIKKKMPLLSFSTLGCPDWDFTQVVNFAAANGYSGIELRGVKRQIDLLQSPAFNSADAIKNSMQLLKEKKLRIVDLGSSAAMHHAKKEERTKNLDEAKRYIDLAEKLDCPYARVFPNDLPKDDTRNAVMELIINGLQQLGDYAKGSKVTVLMESHGDVVRTADLQKIMDAVANEHVGLVWDITNMWTITKEAPADVYAQLKSYIRHTHIKDAKLTGDKIDYVLLGKGDTPIFDAIDILYKDGYKGFYSFEWEKLWHPEIAEPEVALAYYPKAMKEHFKK